MNKDNKDIVTFILLTPHLNINLGVSENLLWYHIREYRFYKDGCEWNWCDTKAKHGGDTLSWLPLQNIQIYNFDELVSFVTLLHEKEIFRNHHIQINESLLCQIFIYQWKPKSKD